MLSLLLIDVMPCCGFSHAMCFSPKQVCLGTSHFGTLAASCGSAAKGMTVTRVTTGVFLVWASCACFKNCLVWEGLLQHAIGVGKTKREADYSWDE